MRHRVPALTVGIALAVLAGAGTAHAQPGDDDPGVPQPGLVTAVANCADGSANVVVFVDDPRDPPVAVRLDQLRPQTSTQTKNTVLDSHDVHEVTFTGVAVGDYNVHVAGLDGPAEDIPVVVTDCAAIDPAADLLDVRVECKAGWGIATFAVTNPKSGKTIRTTLAVDGIPAHVIALDNGMSLQITENGYDDGKHKAKLTGDGVSLTKEFTVRCESGNAPKLDVAAACDDAHRSAVTIGVRNPNRHPVDYTVALGGTTTKVTVAGGDRGTVTVNGLAKADLRVKVTGSDQTEADSVVTVADCGTTTTTTTTTTSAAPVPQGSPPLANTGASVHGLAWSGVLTLIGGGVLLMITRRRRSNQH